MTEHTLEIFYDGACGVCAKEIEHYRKIADQRLRFIDIADPGFRAEDYGRSMEQFAAELHVRDSDGTYYTGVDAFRQIWQLLPPPLYPLLSTFTGLPGVNFASRIGYGLFARNRQRFFGGTGSCNWPGSSHS